MKFRSLYRTRRLTLLNKLGLHKGKKGVWLVVTHSQVYGHPTHHSEDLQQLLWPDDLLQLWFPCCHFFPKAPAKVFFSNRPPTKIILITSPTSSSHHLTYIIIIYTNSIYINIIHLIIYITYIIYIIYIIIIYIIITTPSSTSSSTSTSSTPSTLSSTCISFTSTSCTSSFQELIRRRKTATKNSDKQLLQLYHWGVDSGVDAQEKKSYWFRS